jgi:hypothetical protein
MEAYQAALVGSPQHIKAGARRIKPGTVDELVAKYFASPAFQGLPSAATRATYRGIIEGFRKKHGEKRLAHLRTDDIEYLLIKKPPTIGCAWSAC